MVSRLALHDVENVEAFCLGIIERKLAQNGGYLRADWREELLGELVGESGILSMRYDAARSTSFRVWATTILLHRCDDWYRRKLGDSRSQRRPKEVSLEALADELVVDSHEDAVLDHVALYGRHN